MKKVLAIILICCSCTAFAQDSLQFYNQKRFMVTTTGMKVLGGWGTANVVGGALGWATGTGQSKYFYQMNTIWGAVNLGAAVLGYTGAQKEKDMPMNAAQSLQAQKKIERIFLVNGVLDLAYVGGGIYINHRGNINNNVKQKGYGSAIILQGVFLLLFDSVMFGTHKSNGSKLRAFLAKNPVTFDGDKVGMLIRL